MPLPEMMQLGSEVLRYTQRKGVKNEKEKGAEETASIMARALCFLAQSSGNDIEFNCDIGKVTIERKVVETND